MPQEFHVLQCYSCKMFQVDIVKKSTKWSCKMCGEKQSIKKIFGRGNGKDCRLHVQELNEKRIKSEIEMPFKRQSEVNCPDLCVEGNNGKWSEIMENTKENVNLELLHSANNTLGRAEDEMLSDSIASVTYFAHEVKVEKDICEQECGILQKKKSKWDDYLQDIELGNLEKNIPYRQSLNTFANIPLKTPKSDEYEECKNIIKIKESIDLECYQSNKTKYAINDQEIIPALKVNDAKNLSLAQETAVKNNEEDKEMFIPKKKLKWRNHNEDSKKVSKQKQYESKKRYSKSNMFECEENEDLDCLLQI